MNINSSFLNSQNFLIAAFALHIRGMSKGLALHVSEWEASFFHPFLVQFNVMNLNNIHMVHNPFKLSAYSQHISHLHYCTTWQLQTRRQDTNAWKPWPTMRLPKVPSKSWSENTNLLIYITKYFTNASAPQHDRVPQISCTTVTAHTSRLRWLKKQLCSSKQLNNLKHLFTGEPTYWPSDRNKLPELVDFCVTKGIPPRLCCSKIIFWPILHSLVLITLKACALHQTNQA
jgi:hypothetical protein